MHTFRLKTPYRLVLSVSIPNVVLMIRPHFKCNKKEAKTDAHAPAPQDVHQTGSTPEIRIENILHDHY